jgi:hypothetical protein
MTLNLPNFYHDIKYNLYKLVEEWSAQKRWEIINLPAEVVNRIKSELSADLQHPPTAPVTILSSERPIIEYIKKETQKNNKNNVTRTQAYLEIFEQFPELHWAFLAHMVSRNGGWSMTDLKGELIPHLMDLETVNDFFLFLETCNAYIFQDAYPQLLLYKESVQRKRNLFHLLPVFHVSCFMKPFWDEFMLSSRSEILTIALIINEQNYIEKRIVQHPAFKKEVLKTLAFKAQSILQLNQVFFPYQRKRFGPTSNSLAGSTVIDFTSLKERIEIGKKLYAILFGIRDVFEGSHHFATKVKHSGSRADYWPHIFSKKREATPFIYQQERLIHCTLKKEAPPFYSPALSTAWSDQVIHPPKKFDWCMDLRMFSHFEPVKVPHTFIMTKEYCNSLNTIELAVLAEEHLLK